VLDPGGRRIGKKINGVLVQGFVYGDEITPIAEFDGAGSVVAVFVYATGRTAPDYVVKGTSKYRILADHVGTPRFLIDADTGAVTEQLEHDVWGQVLADTSPGFQPFGFAGGVLDRDTGLVHMGAREYDSATGRFTSVDPLSFGGGDTNLYAYVGGNPLNAVDPSGLSAGALVLGGLEALWDGVVFTIDGPFVLSAAVVATFVNPQPVVRFPDYRPAVPGPAAGAAIAAGAAATALAMATVKTKTKTKDGPVCDDDDTQTCKSLRLECLGNPYQPYWNGNFGAIKDCASCYSLCVRSGRWPMDKCPRGGG
jgi:RHS repeat-associated protein